MSPLVEYLIGLGLGIPDPTHALLRSTKPCPNCATGKLTIAGFKPHSRYFVCTGERINALGVPAPAPGCGHVEYRIVSVIPS